MRANTCKTAAILAVVLALATGAAHAGATETPWDETDASSVRLVSGGPAGEGGGAHLVGLQMRLAPGWKTYWRVPGDSGVPPVFDWSASVNAADIQVMFPVPGRYVDEYSTTIGYKDEVVLPVRVTPENPGQPVTVRLAATYGVCKDICLPVRSEFSLTLDAEGPTSYRSLIDSHMARVPVPGDGAASGIINVARDGEGAKTRLLVDIEPAGAGVVPDVFVEGPAAFYFGTPESTPADGHLRLDIPVDGVSGTHPLSGQELRFTVRNGERLVEQTVSIP